jgi:hypothetical protein
MPEAARMSTRSDLLDWVVEALVALGGSGSVIEVSRQVWATHSDDLGSSGDLFFTWQYDLRWAAKRLRDAGRLQAVGTRGEPWRLVGSA